MPTVEIKWATRRDLCYTASIARELDRQKFSLPRPAQHDRVRLHHLGIAGSGGIAWCVWVDGNPEFSFGFTPYSTLMPHLWSGWAWGSDKVNVAMPEVARWAKGGPGKPSLIDRLDAAGVERIEARSIITHVSSHRWLEWLGFVKECELPGWGKDKQRFVQYRWLRSEFAGFGEARQRHHPQENISCAWEEEEALATGSAATTGTDDGQRGSHSPRS